MKIRLLILIIAAATAPLTASAVTLEDQEAQRWTDHYNTVFKYSMIASGDVIKKHGKAFRVMAWLKECKLDALAATKAPTKEEIQDVVLQYLQKQPDGKQYLWDVLAGVMSSVNYYQFGFDETTAGMHATLGETFCKKATEEVNKLLLERQAVK